MAVVALTNPMQQAGQAPDAHGIANFGGGFVGLLNGTMAVAPECANPAEVNLVPYGGSEAISGLDPGLHKFQCCIHPWMRAAVRVN